MAVVIQERKPALLTYERYLDDLLTLSEGFPREIIDGVRRPLTSPSWTHQQILLRLTSLFLKYLEKAGGEIAFAPLDVVVQRSPLRVREPDLLYISEQRFTSGGGAQPKGPLTTPPELVIEILSPSESTRDINDKLIDYQRFGVDECWLVDPDDRIVTVLRLTDGKIQTDGVYTDGDMVRSVALSDLTVAVDRIF